MDEEDFDPSADGPDVAGYDAPQQEFDDEWDGQPTASESYGYRRETGAVDVRTPLLPCRFAPLVWPLPNIS